jgi:flagellar basal body P-ring protein FlgI
VPARRRARSTARLPYRPLFEDYRARLVGDTVTVQIVEKISATQRSTSSIDKNGKLAAGITAFPFFKANSFARASAAGTSGNTFEGKGTTESSNDFRRRDHRDRDRRAAERATCGRGEKQIGVNHNVDVLRFSARSIRGSSSRQRRRLGAVANVRIEQRGRGPQSTRRASACFPALLPQRAADQSGPDPAPCSRSTPILRVSLLVATFWQAPRRGGRCRQRQAHKELASVQGVRSNQLVGYGLVVGLDGTGDQTTSAPFANQSLLAMLQQMGVTVPAGSNMQLKNLATVMVTASLPAFAQPGQTIDVVVSSLANAKSLRGGTLIATPLKGADGQVYALAQGNLVVGGAGASAAGSKVQINHLSAGRVPDGATVERGVPTPLGQGDAIQLDLHSKDYATARDLVKAINARFGAGTADALDGRAVRVRMPASADARVAFLADIENLEIRQATPAAKVVINARTGSVVMNQGRHAGTVCGRARQPFRHDQRDAAGQPAGAAVAWPDCRHREGRHHDCPAGRLAGAHARRGQARRRRQGAQLARSDTAGPARDPAGAEIGRRHDCRA